jgi:hypothetical protein
MLPPDSVIAAGHLIATFPPPAFFLVVFLADFLAVDCVPDVPAAIVTPKARKTIGTRRIGIRYRFMEKVLSEAASEISSGAAEKGQCEKP